MRTGCHVSLDGITWKTLFTLLLPAGLALGPTPARAQPEEPLPPLRILKEMSLEDLMNIPVISVSGTPEKLTEVASAIQVLTREDIRRSAAKRLPEALRLSPNLQIAQANAHDWAVSARGFNGAPLANNTLADKLLVLIDGRSVYTPLFGGVFWDVQNVLLEDVDRIEIVSGPGGTLWGANAVNGVINVISKSARETQGLYASASAGTFLQDHIALRYGARLDSGLYCRVYGQRYDYRHTELADGSTGMDQWNLTQGGFRLDHYANDANTFTLQGDVYGGRENASGSVRVDGQNLIGRWAHRFSEREELTAQVYFDRSWRQLTTVGFSDQLSTFDFDLRHHFRAGKRHRILWGAGYRLMQDKTHDSPGVFFTPANRTLQLFSGFAQDQIALIPNRLDLTLGTKVLHNDFSGFEVQPSLRLAWQPDTLHTVWAAVSRAVRTPSRFDADETTPAITTLNRNFNAEQVIAAEIGYRLRPFRKISLSLAAYYNFYDNLRSINQNGSPPPPLLFANDQKARTWGFEIFANTVPAPWWRLRGGFTFLDKTIESKTPAVVPGSALFEAIDPNNQVLVQSIMDLPAHFQLDWIGRYVDMLPALPGIMFAAVPAYMTFDIRLAWEYKQITLAVVGQNLAAETHPEFGSRRLPRSLYARITAVF